MQTEKLVGHHCPQCGDIGTVERLHRNETVEFRGESISVTKTMRRCCSCGSEWENTKDPDWRIERNRVFEERAGIKAHP